MSGGHHLLSVGCEGGSGDGDGSVACECDAIGKAILLEACFGDKRWVGMGSEAMGRMHLQMSWRTTGVRHRQRSVVLTLHDEVENII